VFLGRDYWFGNVCVVAVITGLLLCIEGQWYLDIYFELGGRDY